MFYLMHWNPTLAVEECQARGAYEAMIAKLQDAVAVLHRHGYAVDRAFSGATEGAVMRHPQTGHQVNVWVAR